MPIGNFRHTTKTVGALLAIGMAFSFSTVQASQASWGSGAPWTEQKAPLPEEEAFQVEAISTAQGALVRMTPAQGYYLYQERTRFLDAQGREARGAWPKGETHDDPHFGSTLIHRVQVEVPVQIDPGTATLRVDFQGCQDKGICYPPMSRVLSLGGKALSADNITPTEAPIQPQETQSSPSTPTPSQSAPSFEVAQDQAWQERLAQKPLWWLLGAFFLGGLLLSFTPCVLPMVPVVLGLVAPAAQGRKALGLAAAYVVSHALVLAIAGAAGAALGGGAGISQLLQRPSILYFSAAAFALLGAWQAGWIRWPGAWSLGGYVQSVSTSLPKGRLWGAIGLGAGSALILGPCVAPLTAGALLFVAQNGSALLGASSLFVMGLGMGTPLLVMAAGAGHLVPKTGIWMVHLSKIAAMGLFAVVALLLDRATGQQATLWWGLAWFVGSSALWIEPVKIRWVAGAAAAILLIAAVMQPSSENLNSSDKALVFETVSAEDLEKRLQEGRPILLDLDADWCSACITMQKGAFSSEDVTIAAKPFLALRLNLDEIDAGERAFLKQHGLIGPPAILIFDKDGQEVREARLIGEEDADKFKRRLEHFGARL